MKGTPDDRPRETRRWSDAPARKLFSKEQRALFAATRARRRHARRPFDPRPDLRAQAEVVAGGVRPPARCRDLALSRRLADPRALDEVRAGGGVPGRGRDARVPVLEGHRPRPRAADEDPDRARVLLTARSRAPAPPKAARPRATIVSISTSSATRSPPMLIPPAGRMTPSAPSPRMASTRFRRRGARPPAAGPGCRLGALERLRARLADGRNCYTKSPAGPSRRSVRARGRPPGDIGTRRSSGPQRAFDRPRRTRAATLQTRVDPLHRER